MYTPSRNDHLTDISCTFQLASCCSDDRRCCGILNFPHFLDSFPFADRIVHLEVGFNYSSSGYSIGCRYYLFILAQLNRDDVAKMRARIF